MGVYNFCLALGHNVPLATLTANHNIEDIPQIGRPPRTQPVRRYPNRRKTLSGRIKGDGIVTHVWEFDIIPMSAIRYLMTTYFSNGALLDRAVTILTSVDDLNTNYQRYNCYMEQPDPVEQYERDSRYALNLKLTFHSLEAI